MKTWNWTRTALSVATLGLMTVAVGCQDKVPSTPVTPPAKPAVTDGETTGTNSNDTPPPAQPQGGSGLTGGGVEVPPAPPAKTDAEPVTTPEASGAEAPTADAPKNPEEIKDGEKPADAEPAADASVEEKKAE